ncbi:MAG: nucleotide exchange factor GrpE [bacterium]|nr:nucleotide exchange factor GrpE [bacterium]
MKEKNKKDKGKKEDRLDSRLHGNDKTGELQAENNALKEMLQRAQADFINYRQRVEKEKAELIDYGKLETIKDLLEVFDNFERARNHFPKELEGNEWAQGMLAVEKQFVAKMNEMGINRIPTVGQMFDPNLHEAIHMEPAKGKKSNEIIEEYEPGYIYKDKVLRYAKVKLAK